MYHDVWRCINQDGKLEKWFTLIEEINQYICGKTTSPLSQGLVHEYR
jgi:hypothetical protein